VEPHEHVSLDLKPLVKQVLLSVGPLLVVYYGSRLFGLPPYLALALAIFAAAVQAVISMVRKKKVDFILGMLLFFLTMNFTIALLTHNVQTAMLANLVPLFLLDCVVLVSGLIGKPTSLFLVGQLLPSLSEQSLVERGWPEQNVSSYRRLHVKISLLLGFFGIVVDFLAMAAILSFSADVAQLAATVFKEGCNIVLSLLSYKWIRAFMRKHDPLIAASLAEAAALPSAERRECK
jgi:hypothetical protein